MSRDREICRCPRIRLRALMNDRDATEPYFAPALAARGPAIAERAPLPQPMDEGSFCAFFGEMGPALRSYIRRVSGDPALADDIVQETFYRFLRAKLPVMEKFQMKAYLYRTANSLISGHWRRLKRERRWSLLWLFHGESDKKTGRGEDVMSVFEQLKTQEQTLLWLAYVEGFDHREIALALDLKEKSVRVLLFRARKKMAEMLGKSDVGPGKGL
jgi:RNA polymerase sigma-70 factor, ECF subfamily